MFVCLFVREKGREIERETSICGCLSCVPFWGHSPHPGMCPNWESNQQPLGSQAHARSTELHQPGLILYFKNCPTPQTYVFTKLSLCTIKSNTFSPKIWKFPLIGNYNRIMKQCKANSVVCRISLYYFPIIILHS